MMKIVPNKVSREFGRQVLVAKKNSPHIFFGAGIVGIIGSTVLACRATLKLEDNLSEFKEDIDGVKALRGNPLLQTAYSHNEQNKDLVYVYGKGTFSLVRLYGPAAILGVGSVGLLTSSHLTLTRRNHALMATVAIVSKAYEDYRSRVREEFGSERELDIYHSITSKRVDKGNGKTEVVKIADPNRWSPYARFFDEGSVNWKKSPEYNRLFVQCQQNYMNHLLQARGHVFLNEAYDGLGIERSSAGQVVGWVLDQGGDNYIDFGIFEVHNREFVNGQERSILLDFNVDGVIYDKI
jgi:Family of unknown function (DUF6353)